MAKNPAKVDLCVGYALWATVFTLATAMECSSVTFLSAHADLALGFDVRRMINSSVSSQSSLLIVCNCMADAATLRVQTSPF